MTRVANPTASLDRSSAPEGKGKQMQMKTLSMTSALAMALAGGARAALVQVGDFRLPTAATGGGYQAYNTFSFATRTVSGAPLQIGSTFAGTSQNNDATTDATDANNTADQQVNSAATTVTNLKNLSRYNVTAATAKAAGAVAWSFNLSGLSSYLTTSNQTLNKVEAQLYSTIGGGAYSYDVYLSYQGNGSTITPLSSSQTTNYAQLYTPAQGQAAGTMVTNSNGTNLVVLATGVTATSAIKQDLTALYEAGVTQFNLFLVSTSFGQGRVVGVTTSTNQAAGTPSGLYIDTVAAPEPAALLGIGSIAVVASSRRRRRGAR